MGGIAAFALSLFLFALFFKFGQNQVCRTVCSSESSQNINALLHSFRMGPDEVEERVTPRILEGIPSSVFTRFSEVQTIHGIEVPDENQSRVPLALGSNFTTFGNIQQIIPSQSLFGTRQQVPVEVREGANNPGECDILASGISAKGVAEILHLHNKLRNKVAEGKQAGLQSASRMMQLKWNDEIAKLAQLHANNCQFKHNEDFIDKYSNKLGQNVAISFSAVKDLKPNFKKPISDWYAEVKQFIPQEVNPYSGNPANGHFTQLIWGDTAEVGCGYTIFYVKEKANYYKLTVCNYGPGGNVLAHPVYKIGTPCHNCSRCSSKYSGLCEE